MNEENVLNKGRIKQKNVNIFAEKKTIKGVTKKGSVCFAHKKVVMLYV